MLGWLSKAHVAAGWGWVWWHGFDEEVAACAPTSPPPLRLYTARPELTLDFHLSSHTLEDSDLGLRGQSLFNMLTARPA